MTPTQNSPRAEYKKKMHQRQTKVFGSIGVVLAVLLVVNTLFWLNVIPFPFKVKFSTDEPPVAAVPCVEKDAQPSVLANMSVRVYNAGSTQGLAAKVTTSLTTAGVPVTDTTNWGGEEKNNSVTILTGTEGIADAYTLRAFFPRAVVNYDSTLTGNQIDVVLGNNWSDVDDLIATPNEEQYAAAMTPIESCVAASELAAADKK